MLLNGLHNLCSDSDNLTTHNLTDGETSMHLCGTLRLVQYGVVMSQET
jgi:hypothetical protein